MMIGIGIDVARSPGVPPEPDPVLRTPLDGADGATSAVDESPSASVLTFVGNAQLDTAEKVFGTASLLLDGTGDYITIPNSANWQFGAGNFTVHFRMRPTTIGSFRFAVALHDNSTQKSWGVLLINSGGSVNRIALEASTNGSSAFFAAQSGDNAIAANVWQHVAVTRSGDTFRIFVDGVLVATGTNSGTLFASTTALSIGATSGGALPFVGHIDQVVIVKGWALWTTDFTPPSAP